MRYLVRTAAALGAAVLSTLVLSAGSASTATAASDPDPIPPPPGANNWSCHPSAAHPRPVVLVHGTFGNRADNWPLMSPLLASAGYCVFALDYGGATGALIQGTGPVAQSAGQLATFVDQVRAATGASQVDIVGHSQGGMMPRYYLKFLGGAGKVHTLVGLAPSNHGTTIDGLANLIQYFPGAADIFATACPACADQTVGSAFLTKLNSGGDTVAGVHYTVISTIYDEVVTPYQSQRLSGANVTNIVVQDHCPVDVSEHVLLSNDPTAMHLVLNALDPAHATPVLCG
jgi:triacylglycerol esterase/lipase EstA (alpha/beta hydrolase family)